MAGGWGGGGGNGTETERQGWGRQEKDAWKSVHFSLGCDSTVCLGQLPSLSCLVGQMVAMAAVGGDAVVLPQGPWCH